MLSDKDLPAGTGAALSGVGVLGFGGLVSLVVGHFVEAGLDVNAMFILLLLPASASVLPLLLGRRCDPLVAVRGAFR